MRKTLIYTTFYAKNKSYESLIWEWLISLRTLENYKGEVVIFDYGMSEKLIKKLLEFELGPPKIVKLKKANFFYISNRRNIDVIPHLEQYPDYLIAHFDADIWFQKDVSPLWDDCEQTKGVVVGKEVGRACRFRGPEEDQAEYNQKQTDLRGFIFGGFIAGKQKAYLAKLNQMKSLFEGSWKPYIEWGMDQTMITHIIDPVVDNLEGIIYGLGTYFCEIQDTIKCKCGDLDYIHQGKDAIGIHVLAFASIGNENEDLHKDYRFKNRYPELWKKHQ